MKKTILPFILCLFYSLTSFSQIELTKDGLTVIDSDNDYIVYEFEGRGYIQYLKSDDKTKKENVQSDKLRKHRKDKVINPRENTRKV